MARLVDEHRACRLETTGEPWLRWGMFADPPLAKCWNGGRLWHAQACQGHLPAPVPKLGVVGHLQETGYVRADREKLECMYQAKLRLRGKVSSLCTGKFRRGRTGGCEEREESRRYRRSGSSTASTGPFLNSPLWIATRHLERTIRFWSQTAPAACVLPGSWRGTHLEAVCRGGASSMEAIPV